MAKKKGQIEPQQAQGPDAFPSFNIETEIVRYANPTIVKARYRYGLDCFESHGQGGTVSEAEDQAIQRVKNLMGNKSHG